MPRPLDGTAFHVYCRRLGLRQETQELLTTIRSSPPNRTPTSRHGNMSVWYPSKKMQCIIKAESHKVEFAFLLEAEHDDSVLEMWDQPPAIPLEYHDKRGRLQRPMHTADYFVFNYDSAGWQECKPTQDDGRRLDMPVASIINSGAECTILSVDIKAAIAFSLTSTLKMVWKTCAIDKAKKQPFLLLSN